MRTSPSFFSLYSFASSKPNHSLKRNLNFNPNPNININLNKKRIGNRHQEIRYQHE